MPAPAIGLSPRQALFVEEYLLGLGATAAYRRAGYTAKNDNVAAAGASRLLRNVKVQAAIRAARAAAQERTEATLDWVVRGLKHTYNLAMLPVPVLDRKGEPTGDYNYKVAAAVRSLDTLARLLGLFPDLLGHTHCCCAKAPRGARANGTTGSRHAPA